MKKLAFAVAMVAGAVASVFADGEEPAKDLVWTINEPTVSNKTITTMYNKVNVNADFKLDGANLTNVFSGATITIGENAAAPVVVTVTNANGRAWETYQNATLNIKGKGGRLDLHGVAAPDVGWGDAYEPWKSWIGYNYWGNGGTIGRQLKVYFNVDSSVVPADGIVDVAHLYPNGFLGMGEFHNNTPGSIARILFDGGRVYTGHSSGNTWFQPDANTEIRLESVNGKPIYIWFNYTNNAKLTDADGTSSEGKLSTVGTGDLVFGTGNSTIPTIQLGGKVDWGHAGDTFLSGMSYYKTTSDCILPFGAGLGDVYVQRYCAKYNTGSRDATRYFCWLDLNGTTQKVNSIYAYEDSTVEGRTFVTNTSSKRATLEVGEFASDPVVKGHFGGPIDIRVKGAKNPPLTAGQIELANGAELYLSPADLWLAGQQTVDFANIHQPEGATTIFSNAYMTSFAPIGSRTVVSNTVRNVHLPEHPVNQDKPPASTVRDLPPTFLWNLALSNGQEMRVSQGALVTSNLTASSSSRFVVCSNAGIRVQSAAAKPGAGRYYRFTFKENFYKLQFAFGAIVFAKEDLTSYIPGTAYTVNETAATAADLEPGQFMYNGTAFEGKGNLLPETYNGSYRSEYYTYAKADIFNSNGNLFLFENGPKLDRNDPSTWAVFTIRMKEDAPALVGYRLYNQWNVKSHPNCWLVETSADGTNWTTLDEKTDYGSFTYGTGAGNPANPLAEGYQWFNYDSLNGNYGGGSSMVGEGTIFRWTKNVDATTVHADFGGATVRVDRGGLIDAAQTDGTSAIAALEVDVATGAGTFRNVSFAQAGTVNVVAAGTLKGKTVLPMTLESCTGVANLANWSVKINGEANSAATVEWADGNLTLRMNRGLCIFVR